MADRGYYRDPQQGLKRFSKIYRPKPPAPIEAYAENPGGKYKAEVRNAAALNILAAQHGQQKALSKELWAAINNFTYGGAPAGVPTLQQ